MDYERVPKSTKLKGAAMRLQPTNSAMRKHVHQAPVSQLGAGPENDLPRVIVSRSNWARRQVLTCQGETDTFTHTDSGTQHSSARASVCARESARENRSRTHAGTHAR